MNNLSRFFLFCSTNVIFVFMFACVQFLCLKNIRTFLGVCQERFQLKKSELFEAFDLFDVRDFAKVSLNHIYLSLYLSVYLSNAYSNEGLCMRETHTPQSFWSPDASLQLADTHTASTGSNLVTLSLKTLSEHMNSELHSSLSLSVWCTHSTLM